MNPDLAVWKLHSSAASLRWNGRSKSVKRRLAIKKYPLNEPRSHCLDYVPQLRPYAVKARAITSSEVRNTLANSRLAYKASLVDHLLLMWREICIDSSEIPVKVHTAMHFDLVELNVLLG